MVKITIIFVVSGSLILKGGWRDPYQRLLNLSIKEHKYFCRVRTLGDFSGFFTGWLVLMWTWVYELWDLLDALPLTLSVGAITYALFIMFVEPRFKSKLQKYEDAYDGMNLLFWDLTFAVMEGNKQAADVTVEALEEHLKIVI